MAEHLIEAHFVFEGRQGLLAENRIPYGFAQHFRNFSITPEGHIIIRNFSHEFRDKLQEVLFDEDVPFKAILPVTRG